MGVSHSKMQDTQSDAVRIVLVGKTGCGKSATANTILGEKNFESKMSPGSVTSKCQKAFREWKGKKVLVVDTPGLFDTTKKLDTTCKEISKSVLYSSPGPHAIILVMQLNRYTEEEQQVFTTIKALFGESVTKHMIVLFTRKEELGNKSLSDFISDAEVSLRNLVEECGGRCCAFNNKAEGAEKEAQVQELVMLIENMIGNNNYFSDDIHKDVDKRLKERADNLIKIFNVQLEKDIRKVEEDYPNLPQEEKEQKIKALREKHDARIKNIREEAENGIFDDIFKKIRDTVSKIIPSLGK